MNRILRKTRLGLSIGVPRIDQVQLQPNPAPPVPAPTALSAPFALPLTLVGRKQRFTFRMPTDGVSVNKQVLMGMNAAGTKGIGMFYDDNEHWSVRYLDGSGNPVQDNYNYQGWYGGSPMAGHEYAMEFYSPDVGTPEGSIPDSFVVMKMYDTADPTVSLHNFTWQFLKGRPLRPDFEDCSYMRGAGPGNAAFINTGAAGGMPTGVSYGAIPGSTAPLTIGSEDYVVGTNTITVTTALNYYKDAAPTGYTATVNTNPPVAMTIDPTSTKGVAVMKLTIPKPAAGVPIQIRYTDADGSANILGKILTTPSPMRIGQNVTFYNNPMHTNLTFAGSWQDRTMYQDTEYANQSGFRSPGQGFIDANGNLLNMPTTKIYQLRCNHIAPGFAGQIHEISWLEPGNTSGVSQYNVLGQTQDTNQDWPELTAVTYSGGRYRVRGRPVMNSESDQLWVVVFAKGNTNSMTDIRVAEASADFSKRLRTDWLNNLMTPLHGRLRLLEVQQINHWQQNFAWADRPKPGYLDYPNALIGAPIEDWIAMSNHSGRDLAIIIGPYWPKEVVQKTVRALLYGEDMLNGGVGVGANVKIYISTCGNEPWNSGLTGLYHQLAYDAAQDGYNDQNGYRRRIYQQAKIHTRTMAWVKEAIPNDLNRVVFSWSAAPNNHKFDTQTGIVDFGMTKPDDVETSIYVGIGVKYTTYGNNTPEELLAPWLADVDTQFASYIADVDYYKANGISRTCYELGPDNFPEQGKTMGMTGEQAITWAQSPQYIQVYRKALNRFKNEAGNAVDAYYDNGETRFWAHYPGAKWDLLQEVQAAVEGVA